ncbi:lipoprotein [Planomonospora sphaerica]|uniref:Lipoprotein n=1 Tax=Planomonospora sphaerica TaxID=161355 RepID=A0A171CYF7_9ACTN|nr:DUF305 domain-containing protein [Planomonospora sphaerica]GAT67419.1 lipoprotein [Planomonospora sphaerica]
MTRPRAECGARRVPPALPVALLAVAALVAVTGCGAPEGRWAREAMAERAAAAGAARGFNSADVMFLQMMVVHNGQGVELARLARGREVREEVGTLAAAIAVTQEAETAAMAGRLRDWGQPPTAPPDEHAAHGGMPETAAREIASVADAAPADFERAFLNMMIAHQDDAAQLARAEAIAGLHPEVRELAGRIDASRTAQVERMLELLGG